VETTLKEGMFHSRDAINSRNANNSRDANKSRDARNIGNSSRKKYINSSSHSVKEQQQQQAHQEEQRPLQYNSWDPRIANGSNNIHHSSFRNNRIVSGPIMCVGSANLSIIGSAPYRIQY
jgi:hypothetical protein